MKRLLIFLNLFVLMALMGCDRNVYPQTTTEFMMDTVITITVYDGDPGALNGAVKLCREYEQLLSRTVKGSDIDKINNANGQPISVCADTAELINTALDIAKKSDGKFDPTILPLCELWDVTEATAPPSMQDIESALALVGHDNIVLENHTVTAKNGATLDLGGIAKGYIGDKVSEFLKSKNVTSAIINLGGNTLFIGNKNGKDFNVGIQKPFAKNGELAAILKVSDKTAVTSGVYQRYFESDGKIYHHIFDTVTGYPTDNGIYSATVICHSSAIADGLSTACLSLGIEKGTALAKKYGAELVFIDENGKITVSDGLEMTTENNEIIIKIKG